MRLVMPLAEQKINLGRTDSFLCSQWVDLAQQMALWFQSWHWEKVRPLEMEEAGRATKHPSFFVAVKHHTSAVVYRSRALEFWERELVLYRCVNISGDILRCTFSTTLMPLYSKSFSKLEKLQNQGNLQNCCSQEVSYDNKLFQQSF